MTSCFTRQVLCLSAVCELVLAAAPDRVGFNRDIRPIMSDTCFRCHGPDKSSRMAGMRLDMREEATKPLPNGRIPIVPGNPDKSEIVERIFAPAPRTMPPEFAHKKLTEKQKDTIRRWVAEGAVYEGHWAYQPIKRPPVPQLPDNSRVRNAIDNFIQDRLRREGLNPSEEAGKRTLLRRVTFDLTGLPPTPEELRAFLADASPDAYEKVVDRLLASQRYAEQRAMHWLDAVRYADTCGFHGDNPIPAWPYRDYVLNAFAHNKPFDQFTREQIAGDLIPNATLEQKIAAAYNRLNRTSAEGGIQPKEYLAKYGADRVRTLSAVWLGSTMGCAECHDHKFDPFLSKDFYAMKAFFADVQETGLVPDRGPTAWGAQLELPSAEQKQQLEALDKKLAEARARLDDAAAKLAGGSEWERALKERWLAGQLAWTWQHPTAAKALRGAVLTIYNQEPIESNYYLDGSLKSDKKPGDGLVVASGPNPDNETYAITLKPGAGEWNQLGIDVVQDESLPGARYARGADRFLLSEVEAELVEPGAPPRKLPFVVANVNDSPPTVEFSTTDPSMPPMAAIDGDPKTAWGIRFGEARDPFLALLFAEPLKTSAESTLVITLRHESELRKAVIGRFRLALAADPYAWPPVADAGDRERSGDPSGTHTWASGLPEEVIRALRRPAEDRDLAERNALHAYRIASNPSLAPDYIAVERLEAERGLLEAAIPHVVATVSVDPRVTRILPRANWMDDTQPIVEPAIPRFLGVLDTKGERATRLDLANWLVSRDNPLTARAFVNRLWRQFFGTGISKVLDDLGSQGEWPTHPELLDWLAAEFMHPEFEAAGAHDWDMKHMVRLIVTSYTYRQASLPRPGDEAKDPENRLLARQNRYRVDAENVRDTALEVAGLLQNKFGGPSVNPVEPPGYLGALNFPKREYSASHGADLYRRGLYTTWQRTYLHPSLLNFDAPTREECTVSRSASNTPLQALDLLNDPIYLEASRVFAQNALESGGKTFKSRLDWVFDRALNRPPSVQERSILRGLYERNMKRFAADPVGAREFLGEGEAPLPGQARPAPLAAMMTVTRAVLNLHELITRN